MVPGLHDPGVFRIDSFRRVDHILVRSSAYVCKLDAVACHDPFQFAEERIPVRCDHDITVRTGQWGSRYMPGADAQSIVRNALEDDY